MYSSHKRVHCLKFQVVVINEYRSSDKQKYMYVYFLQSVQAPNGLIAHMFGPIEGRKHDAFMLAQSGLHEKLINITKPNGDPYVVYGDPAYGLTEYFGSFSWCRSDSSSDAVQ